MGRSVRSFALGALALILATAPPAAAQRRPATPVAPTIDWSTRVETTAEGGYRMGNPDAPLKLVEYGSVSCSHCADFAEQAHAPLRDRYIRSGRVSFEYRPMLTFLSDPGLFLLLRCQRTDLFFSTLDNLYATQAEWTGRIKAKGEEIGRLTRWSQVIPATMHAAGVAPVFTANGLSQERMDLCLADQAGFNRLVALRDQAAQQGVEGTPTFYLNGRKLDVADWAGVEAAIARP